MRVAWLALMLGGLQEEPDRVILAGREEYSGRILALDADGTLNFETKAGRQYRFPVERLHRIHFGKLDPVRPDPRMPRIQFLHGTTLSARVQRIADGEVSFHVLGREFKVRRSDVRHFQLRPLDGLPPELRDEKKDVVILEEEKDGKKRIVAAYGVVSALDNVRLKLETAAGSQEIPSAAVLRVHFQAEPARDASPGWFARTLLRNGDRVVGILSGVDGNAVQVFSHILGRVSIPKSEIHSIVFLQFARSSVGNLVVTDQAGVKEFDRSGREVWSYANNVQYAWSAVKLENGNYLVANTNYNQVLEVNPQREIVWQLDSVNYPYDAQRLENGNTLVAEYYGNRVTEYDHQKNVVWRCSKVQYPISAQRLENGNTLITGNNQIVEVDRAENEVWRAKLDRIRPWRAMRLESGNTLICDFQRGTVIEIDSASREVWKKDGLVRPMGAVRLEDGNTLILEQGANRVIEVDAAKRQVGEIKGLHSPQGLSSY